MAPDLDPDVTHVVWIGGTSCAGKTTVARLLAEACRLEVYSTDKHFDRHAREAVQQTQPAMYAYQQDDPVMYQRHQAPVEKASLWRDFYTERFPMIVAELAEADRIVAEGVDLLPDCVTAVADPARAVWLLPTRAFWETRHFTERDYVQDEHSVGTADRAWAYYEAMIDFHRQRAAALGLQLIEVDGSTTAAEISSHLATSFGLQPAHEPRG